MARSIRKRSSHMRKKSHKRKQRVKRNKTRKLKRSKVYTKDDFNSGDGMLTSVWGPALWHYMHTMSFNYPVRPTRQDKKYYRQFITNLQFVLPCKYCRMNLKNNLKDVPLRESDMKNRDAFSHYVYRLHEHINKMLGKKSGLTFKSVREQYEHFRARCTIDPEQKDQIIKLVKKQRQTRKREKGCTEPLYGKKSKCIIKIVPQDTKCKTFEVHEKCKKRRTLKKRN